jgi:hypothetical protein
MQPFSRRLLSPEEQRLSSGGEWVARNGEYSVIGQVFEPDPDRPWWRHHLTIRRADREPVRHWRDLQTIKNVLCGPERFGFEVFPPESQVIDNASLTHLWVYRDNFVRSVLFDDAALRSFVIREGWGW